MFQLLLVPLLLLFAYYKVTERTRLPINNYVKFYLVLFLQWALLSMIVGRNVLQDTKVLVLTLLVLIHPISTKTKSLIYPLLTIVGVAVGYAMIHNQDMVAGVRLSLQIGDTLQDPNWIAIFLFAPFCCGLKLTQKKQVMLKIVGLALVSFSTYVVFLTGSRGALLGLIAAMIVWLKVSLKKTHIVGILLIMVVFFLVARFFYSFFVPNVDIDLLERYTTGEVGKDRALIWSRLIPEYFNGNVVEIFLGRGPGSCLRDVGMSAHNMFLEQIFQTGLFGLTLLIIFLIQIFSDTIKNKNDIGLYIITALFTLSLTTPIWGHIYFMIPLSMVAYVNNALSLRTHQEHY